ncbi:MAG: LamG-like jellyroll fold domain-containing protein [Rhabdochlamydiaceae bacterium]
MKKVLIAIAGLLFFFFLLLFQNVYTSNAAGNLVAYWKFDETSGMTATDSSGNGNTGTLNNSAITHSTSIVAPITCFSNPASLHFPGVQADYVSVPDNSSFDPATQITIAFWMNPDTVSINYQHMVFKYNGNLTAYGVWLHNANVYMETNNNSIHSLTSNATVSVGDWHYIAVTFDGTTQKLYIDGSLDNEATPSGMTGISYGTDPSEYPLKIGSGDYNNGFEGYIDDVRFYDRALSASEISNLAGGGCGPDVPTATPTPDPTSAPIQSTQQTTSNSTSKPSAPVCSAQKSPGTPDLFQIDTNSNQATLYFSPVNEPISNYYISYGYTSSDERFGTFTNQGTSTGVLSYTVNFLTPSTTYYFKVRPQNRCMPGNWSNEMKVTTIREGTSPIRYYENFLSQILSIFPQQTTVLGETTIKQKTIQSTSCHYTVKLGDSLWNISTIKLGTGYDYQQIIQQNKLNSTILHAGQILNISC